MQALMESETFDDKMAKEMIERHQLQMSESKLTMLKTRHQMYQLLSDEQKEEFRNMQQSRMMNMYPK
jgi:protein CpxP